MLDSMTRDTAGAAGVAQVGHQILYLLWGVAGQAVHRERHRKVEQHPQGANALGGDPTEPVVTAGVEAPTPKNLSDFYVSLLANHR